MTFPFVTRRAHLSRYQMPEYVTRCSTNASHATWHTSEPSWPHPCLQDNARARVENYLPHAARQSSCPVPPPHSRQEDPCVTTDASTITSKYSCSSSWVSGNAVMGSEQCLAHLPLTAPPPAPISRKQDHSWGFRLPSFLRLESEGSPSELSALGQCWEVPICVM